MLKASPRARSCCEERSEHAFSLGIPYQRMTTTDSDLRVEYFKDGLYGRVYAVPSAHPELNWTPIGGYPHLGISSLRPCHHLSMTAICRMYDRNRGPLAPLLT